MAELILAIAVFTGAHLLPSTPLRGWLIGALGRQVFVWAYSAASVLLFIWVWVAYRSIFVEHLFWVTGPGLHWISALIMLGVIAMIVLALAQRPPVLLTAETALRSDAALKGVVRITRHPLLWPVGIWALLHMLNNADLPSWIFFGYIAALALGGTWLIDRRRAQLLGARWTEIEAQTSNIPFLAILQGRNRLVLREFPPRMLIAAAGIWVLILVLHPYLFGMPAVWL